jgi:hypothetical protein
MTPLRGTLPEPGKRIVRRRAPQSIDAPVMHRVHRKSEDRDGREDSEPSRGWVRWLPVLVGVGLACLAPQLQKWLDAWQPWGMRLVFPYVLLCGSHELGLNDEMTRMLPQLMLFLQFPLEGLLTRLTLRRGVSVAGALAQLIFIHALGAVVLTLIAIPAP